MKTTIRTLFLTILCLALLVMPVFVTGAAHASALGATPTATRAGQFAVKTATPTQPAPTAVPADQTAGGPPTFNIIAVQVGQQMTLQAFNLPARTSFDVYMGAEDTKAVGGALAGQFTSGLGGAITASFDIPAALKTEARIGVRLQATSDPNYYIYNWFYNDRSAPAYYSQQQVAQAASQPQGQAQAQPQVVPTTQASAQSGGGLIQPANEPSTLPSGRPAPTIAITAINPDSSVTFTTYNFPANDRFEVLMGLMGTRGLNGVSAGRIDSGKGGTQTYVVSIPPALYGQEAIAIRVQSISGSKYYAYNWFNNVAGYNFPPAGYGHGRIPGYYGYPTFSIISVARDTTANIQVYNLPPKKTFQVRMGPMGTRGIGGYVVGYFDTGSGGMQSLSFTIPAALYGLPQIAIRIQATDLSGFYAYNWFYNN